MVASIGRRATFVLISLGLGAEAFLSPSSVNPYAKYTTKGKLYHAEPDMDPIITAPPPRDIFSGETYEPKQRGIDQLLYKDRLGSSHYSLASTLDVVDIPSKYQKVKVIGHRGSPYTALENTARSFVHAAQAGACGVELDVFKLKCGTLVVFHGSGGDDNPGLLHSYCGVEGSILDYTAEEARRLLTFNRNFEEFGCGPLEITHPDDDTNHVAHYCYVHTLEEVLATLRDHPDVSPDFTIKIELKGPDTAFSTVELVKKMNMKHMCQYSSFEHSRIAEVKMVDPDAITGALFVEVPHDFVERSLAVGANEVHFKYDTCTTSRVEAAHAAGLGTMVWFRGPIGMTEDFTYKYLDVGNEDEAQYETVLRTGVQSMCVNRPAVLVEALKRMNSDLPRI